MPSQLLHPFIAPLTPPSLPLQVCNTFTQLAAALADSTPDWLCPLLGEAPGCAPTQRVRLVCASQVRRDPTVTPHVPSHRPSTLVARAARPEHARPRPRSPACLRPPSPGELVTIPFPRCARSSTRLTGVRQPGACSTRRGRA